MTILIAILALAEFAFFFIYDLRLSKDNRSERHVIRLMSCTGGMALILLEIALPCPVGLQELAVDLSMSTAILVLYPCSFEKPKASFVASTYLLASGLASFACFGFRAAGTLDFKCQRAVCSFVPMFIFVLCYFLYIAYLRFTGIRMMFRHTAVWHNVEEHSRFLYSLAFLVAGMLFIGCIPMSGHWSDALSTVSLMMFLGLYALLYLRAMTGRTFVLNRETEKKIKDIIKGNLRTTYAEKVDEDKKMSYLYKRVVMYMEEKRPYLSQTFDMSYLADRMLTNKLYLSKTINVLSGRNFRQFVNYYRVRRAMELFKEDPRLKINEVSEMSGFRTAVSFNMAFKMNTGKTPTEWLQDYVAEPQVK